MANLLNWGIVEVGGMYASLSGIVLGHSRLCDGTVINSSDVQEIKRINEDELEAVTYSGSHYILSIGEMDTGDSIKESTLKILNKFGVTDIDLDCIKEKKDNCVEQERAEADKELSNNELMIIMAGVTVLNAYYKDTDVVEKCTHYVHVGMLEDSVLIQSYGKVDFRFFTNCPINKIYHWSNGLKRIVVKNIAKDEFAFVSEDKKILVNGNGITVLTHEEFGKAESLFSPDCVDGKSLLSYLEVN